MSTEYERERERKRGGGSEAKDKENDANPLCMEKPSGPPSRLRARADFANKLFNRCNIPCKYSVSRLDDVTFLSGRSKSYLVISRDPRGKQHQDVWSTGTSESNWTLSSDRYHHDFALSSSRRDEFKFY